MSLFGFEGRTLSRCGILALTLALAGSASLVYYHLGLFMPRVLQVGNAKNLGGGYAFGNDFYPVWLTSRECVRDRSDPYSAEMTHEIQQGLFGRPLDSKIPTDPLTDYRTFAYPAFTDLLFWPAAEVPFTTVRVLLVILLATTTATSVWLWMRAMSLRVDFIWSAVILLLVLCSYPVLEGLYADQLGLLVGFLLAAAMLALQRGRLLLSGGLLALTTIKPQMTVIAIFYLLLWGISNWRAHRRFCIGLLSTMLALVGAATIVWPRWITSWIRVVLGYHRYAKPPLVNEVLAAPFGSNLAQPISAILIALLLATALWMAWRNRNAAVNSIQFWLTLSLLLCVTSVTLLPGQALHDHVIFLPAIFLIVSIWRQPSLNWIRRLLRKAGIAILLWPWVSAFTLIVLRPLLTHKQFYSKAVFALPLRTAAIFPFVVLGLLTLTIRDSNQFDRSELSSFCRQ